MADGFERVTDVARTCGVGGRAGYDRLAWQLEEFEHSGQRFLDWEEVEMSQEQLRSELESTRGGSDSELIGGHDEANGISMSGCMDTMDLLDQPSCRSYCQGMGAFAAYRPRGGFYVGAMYMYCRPDWLYVLKGL